MIRLSFCSCVAKTTHRLLVAIMLAASATSSAEDLPETCYLFAHFYYNGDTGLHLAWSADGHSWEMLNEGKSYLTPEVGDAKLVRDPSVCEGPDGRYHMVWTDSWTGRTIGYASTLDFKSWSPQKEIAVMGHEPEAQNSWAPEVTWDAGSASFIILWSSTITGLFPETALSNRRPSRNHRIYVTTTKDFESFTPTRLYYDGGFNVIDAALVPNGDEWLMFVKNEQLSPTTQKNVRMVRAKTVHGPFGAPSAALTGDYWAEGPFPIRMGEYLYVYFDKHMQNAYGAIRTRDLVEWEDVSETLRFPTDARHGSFVPVPRSLIQELRQKN